MVAAQSGHASATAYLLKRGALVNKCDNMGHNSLFFACKFGQSTCAEMLIARGAEFCTDGDGVDPLELCIHGEFRDCASLLIMKFPWLLHKIVSSIASSHPQAEKVKKTHHGVA